MPALRTARVTDLIAISRRQLNRVITPSALSMRETMETEDVHPEDARAYRMTAP